MILLKNKNILVTGGAGFIGSHLTNKLLTLGAKVTVIVKYNSIIDCPRLIKVWDRIKVIEADLRNTDSVKDIAKMKFKNVKSNFDKEISDILLLTPQIFYDERGFFMESWNQEIFNNAVGNNIIFKQDNHSKSKKGVLRGLHFQTVNRLLFLHYLQCLA